MADGDTLVIGGLYTNSTVSDKAKMPFLGDMPVPRQALHAHEGPEGEDRAGLLDHARTSCARSTDYKIITPPAEAERLEGKESCPKPDDGEGALGQPDAALRALSRAPRCTRAASPSPAWLVVPLAGLPACVHEREKAFAHVEAGALAPRAVRARPRRPTRAAPPARKGWGAFRRREGVLAGASGGAGLVDRSGGGGGRSDAATRGVVPDPESGATFVPTSLSTASATEGASPIVDVPRVPADDDGGVRVEPGPRIGTSSAPPAHRPLPPGASLERIAREKFLSAETEIRAEKVTLYVPAVYAAEASLTGATVVEEAPGRRTAVGGATLVLRRLTIRAERLTLVAKSDPASDVQLLRARRRLPAQRPAREHRRGVGVALAAAPQRRLHAAAVKRDAASGTEPEQTPLASAKLVAFALAPYPARLRRRATAARGART